MRILALDLATRTGFAVGEASGEPRFGTKVIGRPGESIGKFANLFDEWLSDMITLEAPELIVFEAPILPARTTPDTARKLMGLAFLTELICYRRDVRCREANIMTVKKFFTGRGRASKAEMIEAAASHGWICKDDNEADALGVWALAGAAA